MVVKGLTLYGGIVVCIAVVSLRLKLVVVFQISIFIACARQGDFEVSMLLVKDLF
jgi:hypothetical protein